MHSKSFYYTRLHYNLIPVTCIGSVNRFMNRHERRALKARKVSMPKKTQDEIKQEYFQMCAQAGELQYRIAEFQSQLKELNGNIQSLNRDFSEALAAPVAPVAVEGASDVDQASPGPV